MANKIFTTFVFLVFLFAFGSQAAAQNDGGERADLSQLLQVNLPAGALRLDKSKIPAEFDQLFDKLFAATDGKIKKGRIEVLGWVGNRQSKASRLMNETVGNLQTAGWNYEVGEKTGGLTFFVIGKTAPTKRGFAGFWAATDDGLILVLAEMLAVANAAADNGRTNSIEMRSAQNISPADAQVFNLSASDEYVNVMGGQMPKLPAFDALPKKPGKLRGFVKDLRGNPLEGAYIGVRASAVGGFYSGASGETDARGFYEIEMPWGAAHFYAAGYTIDYGDGGRAAVGLHPVDGKAGSFATAEGAIENFVLLPYGLGDRDAISEKPWDGANYYGGSIRVNYQISSGDMWAAKGSLPPNSEIEITLAPEGEMLDGTAGKTFVVRRKTGGINFFHINNIPIGRYRMSARLVGGKTLKMIEGSYGKQALFGLQPSEATGSAGLLFAPGGAKPLSALPNHGNWKAVNVELRIP
jgi:hypothetical protein